MLIKKIIDNQVYFKIEKSKNNKQINKNNKI